MFFDIVNRRTCAARAAAPLMPAEFGGRISKCRRVLPSVATPRISANCLVRHGNTGQVSPVAGVARKRIATTRNALFLALRPARGSQRERPQNPLKVKRCRPMSPGCRLTGKTGQHVAPALEFGRCRLSPMSPRPLVRTAFLHSSNDVTKAGSDYSLISWRRTFSMFTANAQRSSCVRVSSARDNC